MFRSVEALAFPTCGHIDAIFSAFKFRRCGDENLSRHHRSSDELESFYHAICDLLLSVEGERNRPVSSISKGGVDKLSPIAFYSLIFLSLGSSLEALISLMVARTIFALSALSRLGKLSSPPSK